MSKGRKPKLKPRQRAQVVDWRSFVGGEACLQRVEQLVANRRLPSIVLFHGRQGIGKSLLAGKVAALHYCESENACGHCPECCLIRDGGHPEVLWIDSKNEALKVCDAEEILDHLQMTPQARGKNGQNIGRAVRMAVVIDVDLFSESGINRLLKTFEEAPENAQVILTTSCLHSLLPTLLSRCIKWHVAPPALADSLEILKSVCEPAIIESYGNDELVDLLKRCGLSPGKVLALIDPGKREQEFHELCRNLALAEKFADAITYAESVVVSKPTADAVAREVELAINQSYRQEFLTGKNHHLQPHFLQIRRRLLGEIKRYGGRKRVALNAQLCAEALALSQIGVEEF